MPGLILEGGTFRPVFTCGVMDALLDHDLMFDYVIGVSAGITYAFSYLSRQRGRNLEVFTRFRNDKRYLSMKNYAKHRSMFGLDFVFDEIPNELLPFDWEVFRQFSGRVLVGVTNAQSGDIEYLDGKQLDTPCTMLRATCAIPFYFPAIEINGQKYYDGGLADSIPIVKSIKDGNSKNLVILTRPESYRKDTTAGTRVAAKALRRTYPKMSDVLLSRANRYNETVCLCNQLAQKRPNDTVLIRPEYSLKSFEKDVSMLKKNYEHGYDLAIQNMDQIKSLF